MVPNEVSDKPGKDSMGMEMVPFEVEESGAVRGRRPAGQDQRGTAAAHRHQNDDREDPAHPEAHQGGRPRGLCRAEHLHRQPQVRRLGGEALREFDRPAFRKGEPLFDIYSPELVAAQQEYLIALKANDFRRRGLSMLNSAREKLRLWDITDQQVEELGRTGQFKKTVTVFPRARDRDRKGRPQGQKIMAGEALFKIADLSRVWILGEIYEYELPFIRPGRKRKSPSPITPENLSPENHLHLSLPQARDADEPGPDRGRQPRP